MKIYLKVTVTTCVACKYIRKYEPDPSRFTTMEEYEACEKKLIETLTHVTQRRVNSLNSS